MKKTIGEIINLIIKNHNENVIVKNYWKKESFGRIPVYKTSFQKKLNSEKYIAKNSIE